MGKSASAKQEGIELREGWYDILRDLAREKGYIDWELFRASIRGMSARTIRRHAPTPPTLRRIADSLGITLVELCEEIGKAPATADVTLVERPAELALYAEKGNRGALRKLVRLSRRDNAEALGLLGIMHLAGNGISKNKAMAASLFRQAAALDNPMAMRELGVMFEQGLDGDEDNTTAVEWYTKASNLGDIKAKFKLARMYLLNRGVPTMEEVERLKIAVLLLEAAAAPPNPYPNALNQLGFLYKKGKGVPQSLEIAAALFRLGADMNNIIACANFGVMCLRGEGMPANIKLAITYLRRAARGRNPDSQFHLSKIYESGSGMPRDDRSAVRWLHAAAGQGHTQAERELGDRYAAGRGVKQDFIRAHRWLTRAANKGDAAALASKNAIERHMTQRQIAQTAECGWSLGDEFMTTYAAL